MSEELVKCPCCDRMVPANALELTFRKPDDIAIMMDEEIEERCRYNDDIFICDDEYYFVRCILPLPVHDKGDNYCLGVWVQVSENSFTHIYDLWEVEDQTNENPIHGLLANDVPLTTGSKNAEVSVQLVGAQSRPVVTVVDHNCSLHQEQTCGITIHRANEYSEICK
jgi:hypothetical protein